MTKIVWCFAAVLALVGCDAADKTAETACANASCPPGTAIEMNAQSTGSCSGSMEFSADQGLTDQSASGAASGACYSTGSCVYACFTTTECCGSETWTQDSYTCSQVCDGACGNGECETGEDSASCPEDCSAFCGNEECEYGEVCISQQCDGPGGCSPCPGDCCPVCGDGVCEWPEDGNMVPDQACPEDCDGAACQPVCESFKYCGSDGRGSTCPCAGGQDCSAEGECVPGTGSGSSSAISCANSIDCKEIMPPAHCVDGECEACPAKCAGLACDAVDCGGCGQCAEGEFCKDNGECFTPPSGA